MSQSLQLLTTVSNSRTTTTSLPAPPSTAPPATLTTHLALSDPVKLALLREFPLVVDRLKKTERGVARMRREAETGDGQLNQAFGWLHYRELHCGDTRAKKG
jgi:U3 small nucleolar RNA-associated protein 3